MDISVIPIVNSKAIRLTKTILDKYNIADTIELILKKDFIILKPKTSLKAGWEKSFQKMHNNGDDKLLMPDVLEDENTEQWT